MESWYFELLGSVRIHRASRHFDALFGKKPGAVLALLALSPGRMRSREELVDLIWPEVELEDARNRFRVALFELRKLLEPPGTPPGSVLFTSRTQVGIVAGHTSDVAAFESFLRQAATTPEPAVRAQHLRAALALVKGEFAPGFYLDVLLTERERLSALAQNAKERLDALESAGAPTAVVAPSPAPRNRFFGRITELEELHALLQNASLITVLGQGGTGKTRLARELQAQLPKAHFVALAGLRSGRGLLDTLVSSLALPSSSEPSLLRLQRTLVQEPACLILDNVEQLVENGGPEAIQSLLDAVPSLQVLVTSRTRLNLPHEQIYPLPTLEVPLVAGTPERLLEFPSIALFADRARMAQPRFEITPENAEAVAELCRRLDGLPLAIELAAARIAVLSPAQILLRLSRRFDLLADKRRDREERHASLRAALDWSWNLLSSDMQHFFAQLSVFRGSFSLDAVEALTQEPLAVDYLQSLIDTSLVISEAGGPETRFRLFETLREYGQEKLALSSGDARALYFRHADFYLRDDQIWMAPNRSSVLTAAMASLRLEHDNLTVALDRMLEADPERARELCTRVTFFWQHMDLNRVAVSYLERAIEAAERVGLEESKVADLQVALGGACYLLRMNEQTTRAYLAASPARERAYARQCAALEECESAGGSEEQLALLRQECASAANWLGYINLVVRRYTTAQKYLEEALRLLQRLEQPVTQAWALFNLGKVTLERGLQQEGAGRRAWLEQSLQHYDQSDETCRKTADERLPCFLPFARYTVLRALERWDELLAPLQEGLARSLARELPFAAYWYVQGYYDLALHQQDWETAAALWGMITQYYQQNESSGVGDAPELPPPPNWLQVLGQERFTQLYEIGLHARLESVPTIVAPLHTTFFSLPAQN